MGKNIFAPLMSLGFEGQLFWLLLLFIFCSKDSFAQSCEAYTNTYRTERICAGETIEYTTAVAPVTVVWDRNGHPTTTPNSDYSFSGPGIIRTYLSSGYCTASIYLTAEGTYTYYFIKKNTTIDNAWCHCTYCSTESGSFTITVTDTGKPTTPTYTVTREPIFPFPNAPKWDIYNITTSGCTDLSSTVWSTRDHWGGSYGYGEILKWHISEPTIFWAECTKHKDGGGLSVADYCYSGRSQPICIVPRPSILSSPSTLNCGKGIVTLTASGCDNGTVTWSDGQKGISVVTDTLTGNTTFTATCTANCQDGTTETSVPSESLTIIVKPKPPKPNIASSTADSLSIKLTADGCENNSSYVWGKKIVVTGLWESIEENGKEILVPAVSDECRQYRCACYKSGCQGEYGYKELNAPSQLSIIKDQNFIKTKCLPTLSWKQSKGCETLKDSAKITISKNGLPLFSKDIAGSNYQFNIADFPNFFALNAGGNLNFSVDVPSIDKPNVKINASIDIPIDAEPVRKPGSTVLIHGFQLTGNYPQDFKDYAQEIRQGYSVGCPRNSNGKIPNGCGATIYINKNDKWVRLDGENGSGDTNQEKVFLYDWASQSNTGILRDGLYKEKVGYIEQAATNLYALLKNPKGDVTESPLKPGQPLTFIPHSRGVPLSLQVFHRLYKTFGESLDINLIAMDGHPATTFGDGANEFGFLKNLPGILGNAIYCNLSTVGCGGVGSLQMQVPCNVKTAQNFYRADGTYEGIIDIGQFDGTFMLGAINCKLNDFKMSFFPELNPLVGGKHSGVHKLLRYTFNPFSVVPNGYYDNNDILCNETRKCKLGYEGLQNNPEQFRVNPDACASLPTLDAQYQNRHNKSLSIDGGDFEYTNGMGFWGTLNYNIEKLATIFEGCSCGLLGAMDYNAPFSQNPTYEKLNTTTAEGTAYYLPKLKHELLVFPEGNNYLNFDLRESKITKPNINITLRFLENGKQVWAYQQRFNTTNSVFSSYSVPIPAELKGESGYFEVETSDTTSTIHIDNFEFSNTLSSKTFDFVEQYSQIESVQSGDWNSRSTWSCYCVPTLQDNVKIKNPHRVILTNQIGSQFCKSLLMEKGATIENNSTLLINKPD